MLHMFHHFYMSYEYIKNLLLKTIGTHKWPIRYKLIKHNRLGQVSIVVYVMPSLWHMHMYPFGAAASAKQRPWTPHGELAQGSKIWVWYQWQWTMFLIDWLMLAFRCRTIRHLDRSIITSTYVSMHDISSYFTFTITTWIRRTWIYTVIYRSANTYVKQIVARMFLDVSYSCQVFSLSSMLSMNMKSTPTWISTFKHRILSIWTLTIIGNMCLIRCNTFTRWSTWRRIAWI
jgi:hypothetical protein